MDAKKHNVPPPEAFADAFLRMEAGGALSQNDKDMLICHHNATAMTLTSREMSRRMGWRDQSANTHYAKLGSRIADYLVWNPSESNGAERAGIYAVVTMTRPCGEYLWTLRPQIAEALLLLDWPGLEVSTEKPAGPSVSSVVEHAKYEWQERLERTIGGPSLAKARRGYKCEACDMTFSDVYGEIGANFIEAHHKHPLSTIEPGQERSYTADDFTVLCSNCHRMIHRWPSPDDPKPEDVEGFRAMVQARRAKQKT